MDMALPSAPYDLRLTCATELSLDTLIGTTSLSHHGGGGHTMHNECGKGVSVLHGWTTRRVKR